jgi:hypothetical protein
MTIKQKIYHEFGQLLAAKISNLHHQLNDLKESTANETKSTAGDKYETGRAMLQIEQDHVRRQLQELLEQQSIFLAIDGSIQSAHIIRGSLVKTNRGWFLICPALGKVMVENRNVTALSPQSPLGKEFMNLGVGSIAVVNGKSYSIEEIV